MTTLLPVDPHHPLNLKTMSTASSGKPLAAALGEYQQEEDEDDVLGSSEDDSEEDASEEDSDDDDDSDDYSDYSDLSDDDSDLSDDEEAFLEAEQLLQEMAATRRGGSSGRSSMSHLLHSSMSIAHGGGAGSNVAVAEPAVPSSGASVRSLNRLAKGALDSAPLTIGGTIGIKATPPNKASAGTRRGRKKGTSPGPGRRLENTSGNNLGLRTSVSNPNLASLVTQLTQAAEATAVADGRAPSPQKKVLNSSSSVQSLGHISQITSTQDAANANDNAMKPDEYLAKLLSEDNDTQAKDDNTKSSPTLSTFTHEEMMDGFYLPVKDEYVAAWTNQITHAVRQHDLATLRSMHAAGERLQACNQFGESIVHLCVRRGTPEMLKFLLQDAGVSMRVADDYGRNPLHDACWNLSSARDNVRAYTNMALLLQECPLQLLIQDKRGSTPLGYVPRQHWADCNAFLERQKRKGRLQLVLPK